MTDTNPYVKFVFARKSTSGLTNIWGVASAVGRITLGIVSWKGTWRKYVFFPADNTVFDTDCLETIANFCKIETANHKINATTKRP